MKSFPSIHFQHQGNDVEAVIVDIPETASDQLVLRLQNFQQEIGSEIELEKVQNKWHPNSNLHLLFPDTFDSLINALEEAGY